MGANIKNLKEEYRHIFTKIRVRSLCVAFVLLALSMIFQSYASAYSNRNDLRFVGDMLLDNLPVVNLNLIVVEGALCAILFAICLLLVKPRYIIFTLKTAAIFISIRSVFVAVTHLGVYPGQIVPGKDVFDQIYVALNLEAGYFFSAHTGLPFLMGLIFWPEKRWRLTFFCLSCIFGISVLLAHIHYSIDVFAAPFITYSIFKMSQYLFSEDYKLISDQ